MRASAPRTLGAFLGALLIVGLLATPAAAVPPPPNPTDDQLSSSQSQAQAAAGAVAQVSGQLAEVNKQLELLEIQTEAAADEHTQAEAAVQLATAKAAQTAQAVITATGTLDQAETAVQSLARDTYMQGSFALSDVTLLDADGPADFIDRSNMLNIATDLQVATMQDLQLAKVAQSNADSAARNAVVEKQAAEKKAKDTLDALTVQLAQAESASASLQAQQASLSDQLTLAQQNAANLAGQRAQYDAWVAAEAAAKAAAEAAAAAKAAASAAAAGQASPGGGGPSEGASAQGWAIPAGGYLSSCFCARWGVFHYGVDIAAPMYTPVYAAGPGTVMRSGAATGFGQAIYIQHDDGWVTVYGHMETLAVSAGQRVAAGQKIAGVGMRGFSTGPHLHFEVTRGMYGARVDPIPWLAARGVYL